MAELSPVSKGMDLGIGAIRGLGMSLVSADGVLRTYPALLTSVGFILAVFEVCERSGKAQ